MGERTLAALACCIAGSSWLLHMCAETRGLLAHLVSCVVCAAFCCLCSAEGSGDPQAAEGCQRLPPQEVRPQGLSALQQCSSSSSFARRHAACCVAVAAHQLLGWHLVCDTVGLWPLAVAVTWGCSSQVRRPSVAAAGGCRSSQQQQQVQQSRQQGCLWSVIFTHARGAAVVAAQACV